EALIKRLLHLTEEGEFYSVATGTTYPLGKYTFLFTGNDGERLFRGVPSDDMRQSIWEANKSGDRVRRLLREAGVPEAFIGRAADAVLFRPLNRQEIVEVAKKLLLPVFDGLRESYGVTVEYSPKFLEQFGRTFFTQDLGGRSIRNVIDFRLG